MRGGGIFQEDVFVFIEFGCVFDLVEQDLVFDFRYNVLGDRYFGLVAVVDLEVLDGLGVGFGYELIKVSIQIIQYFQISSRNQVEVTVIWDIVSGIRNQVLFYQVKSVFRFGGYGDIFLKNIFFMYQNYIFKNLNFGIEYSFQVGF